MFIPFWLWLFRKVHIHVFCFSFPFSLCSIRFLGFEQGGHLADRLKKINGVGMIEQIAITRTSTRMNVECSACHLDADFLSQGSGTPVLYLTRCGHICCDMCRTNWFANGKETCPKCRQPQTRSNLIRIYYDIAQRAQPSTPSATATLSKGTENDFQVSSERFLQVIADQATDVVCACVTLLSGYTSSFVI